MTNDTLENPTGQTADAATEVVDTTYESSPVKRNRRTNAQIEMLNLMLIGVLDEIRPATVRQTYYQAVSRGLIDKTEQGYKTIVRMLTDLRRARRVPFDWIADNTRWMRKPDTHGSLNELLINTARTYRRDVWADQDVNVEIWLEKDALSGVLYDVTAEYDVPLMVTRGYPSITFLQSAAEQIGASEKPTFVYYFGDHDPSGIDIPVKVEAGLREFAPDAEIHFDRVAVTKDQIVEFKLPTRPTKKTDSRSKNFEGESVEVDAIPPDDLRAIARECIEQHIDRRRLAALEVAEQSEREFLQKLAAGKAVRRP